MKAEDLTRKFYEGETSLKEEYYLREILKHEENTEKDSIIRNQLKAYRQYSENESLPPGWENKFLRKITEPGKKKISAWYRKPKIVLIAASIAIIICSAFSLFYFDKPKSAAGIVITQENLVDNKVLALNELQKAFKLFSDNYRQASERLDKLGEIGKYLDNKHNSKYFKNKKKEK